MSEPIYSIVDMDWSRFDEDRGDFEKCGDCQEWQIPETRIEKDENNRTHTYSICSRCGAESEEI